MSKKVARGTAPRSISEIEASLDWHRTMRTQNAEVFAGLEAELRAAKEAIRALLASDGSA